MNNRRHFAADAIPITAPLYDIPEASRSMSRQAFISLLVYPLLFSWLPASSPPAVRTVQVATKTDATALRQEQENLRSLGYSPVWAKESDGRTLLLVGKCERHVDAVLLRNSLRTRGFNDAFTKAFKELVAGDFETEAVAYGGSSISESALFPNAKCLPVFHARCALPER